MADSIKEKLVEKAVDVVLDLFTSMSIDELRELLDKNKYQKALYKVICDFQKSSYFHREYHGIIYVDNQEMVFSIPDDDINPAKTVKEIQNAIAKAISRSFITDSPEDISSICQYIASVYLQRTKIMLQIYDILPQMRENFEKLDKELVDLKHLIEENNEKEIQMRHEREILLKTELHNEVSITVSDMIQLYLYLVLKKAPTFEGNAVAALSNAMAEKVREVIDSIDDYVEEDFLRTPVVLTIAKGTDTNNQSIPYLKYSEHCFRKGILEHTTHLIQYQDIIDAESFLAILRLRNDVQGNFFLPLDERGQGSYINADDIKLDLAWAKSVLYKVGEEILIIYNNLV